ncbi:MAG TPA: OsmC family protein [Herpetosiphonaceae bacterium]
MATTVTVRSINRYQQEIIAGDHIIFADEPTDIGGDDTGPNPYELLLGALGSCKAITVTMYAQRKGWDLQGVEVELTHTKDYAADCEACVEKDVKLDRISVRLSFKGSLDDAQRQRLKEIAGRCPVHQTLTSRIDITDA